MSTGSSKTRETEEFCDSNGRNMPRSAANKDSIRKCSRTDRDFSGLHFGQVEQIVHEVSQVLSRAPDELDLFFLFRR